MVLCSDKWQSHYIATSICILFLLCSERIETGFRSAHAATSVLTAPVVQLTHSSLLNVAVLSNRQRCLFSRKPYFYSKNKEMSLLLRGGAVEENSDSDVDSGDEEDFDFGSDGGFDVLSDADDFSESNIAGRTLEIWKTTPPFTKAYLSASMVATAIGYFSSKDKEFPKLFLLEWEPTFLKLQLWRPFTAFLNFGPFGFGYIMTWHFVWMYMSTLERLHHDKPYDFWVMILFGCVTMVAGYSILGISPRFLGHNLSTFLVYIWSRYHEGMEVNIMELFNARAEMLPWFFLAQTALLEGELPILDLLGIVFGHIYHHCKVSKILVTPAFLVEWYKSDNPYSRRIRNQYKLISEDFEMQ